MPRRPDRHRVVFLFRWWARSLLMAEPEWLKVSELAARAGVNRTTIWTWADKGLVEIRRLEARTGVRARLRTAEELRALTTPLPAPRRPPAR